MRWRNMNNPLPTGTVTFLFTDIQGSTPLWERESAVMRAGVRSGTWSRWTVLRNRPWDSGACGWVLEENASLGWMGSSGTQIQWPCHRISGKSCGVTGADMLCLPSAWLLPG